MKVTKKPGFRRWIISQRMTKHGQWDINLLYVAGVYAINFELAFYKEPARSGLDGMDFKLSFGPFDFNCSWMREFVSSVES